jgi:endoglucanase
LPFTDIFDANLRLKRSINLTALDAPTEGEWGETLQENYFQLLADAGFTAIRIPIRFSAHAGEEPPYTITPSFLARVDWAVQNATSRGMVAIVDMHHYLEMFTDPTGQTPRFLALWEQLSEHYQDVPDSELYFELLNEPTNDIPDTLWNDLVAEVISIIRQSNPTRPIIVDAPQWAFFYQVQALELPDDPNLIVTFHYYEPLPFTHQGAYWIEGMDTDAWLGTTWEGTPDQVATITWAFDFVADWARNHNRPIFVGEFGSLSYADMASRVRWTTAVREAAEEQSFSWAYHCFSPVSDSFGLYNVYSNQWVEGLLRALIPE